MPETLLNILDAILTQLAGALPIIAAVVASLSIDVVRTRIGEVVPRVLYPILLPIVGAIVAGVARGVGVDIGDFNAETANLTMWQTVVAGALTGSATVGLKEARKAVAKLREPVEDPDDWYPDGP